jgi:hypothetical protein
LEVREIIRIFARLLKTNYLINEDEADSTHLSIHNNDAMLCYDPTKDSCTASTETMDTWAIAGIR